MGELAVTRPRINAVDPLSVWVKIGLTGLFLALATPLVGLSGLWMTALLGQLAAEGLALSHATLPTFPLDGDWDLRLAYLAALVAMGLRAAVSKLPKPTWQIAGLGPWPWWLLMGSGLWLTSGAALVFEQHVLDIADGTHFVLLGATSLWTMATTTWLLASAGHAGLVHLTLAARRSRVVGGVAAAGGIASMAIATPVLANPETLGGDDVYRDAPMLSGALEELNDARRELRGSMHGGGSGTTPAALPPAAGGSTQDSRYTTAECMEELTTRPTGSRLSPVEEIVHNVEQRLAERDLAREVVHTKLIDICVDKPKRGKPLVRLLQRATGYGIADVYRGRHRDRLLRASVLSRGYYEPQCLIDGRSDQQESFEDLEHRHFTIETALRKLSDSDELLIRDHYFAGLGYEEMARARNKRKDTVNRNTTRALKRLGGHLASHCL